ncbi:ZIP family metal transporter [Microbacterium aureliae]
MGLWLAALSGLIAGGSLLGGAAVAWFVTIPRKVVAAIMAVGAGVLIATLAFELVEEAASDGGLVPTVSGFLGGAVLYVVADRLVSRPHRQTKAPANIVARRGAGGLAGGSGLAIALGALIDGIPESIVMGLSVLQGGLSLPIVAAVAISNIPEGLGSTAELKRGGTRARTVFLLWSGIAVVTVVAAVVGYLALQTAPAELVAVIMTVAAGGLLAMVANTMIPEAFEREHGMTGLWATMGFLGAFVLHQLQG